VVRFALTPFQWQTWDGGFIPQVSTLADEAWWGVAEGGTQAHGLSRGHRFAACRPPSCFLHRLDQDAEVLECWLALCSGDSAWYVNYTVIFVEGKVLGLSLDTFVLNVISSFPEYCTLGKLR